MKYNAKNVMGARRRCYAESHTLRCQNLGKKGIVYMMSVSVYKKKCTLRHCLMRCRYRHGGLRKSRFPALPPLGS
jgi:hypothetical protein